ncbi:MAG: polysaccharide deacetylase family protein [Oscillospiraceae bacterium]|nr:polysaccharide deacetylase family protein [Oscillospiraceae bacterium]
MIPRIHAAFAAAVLIVCVLLQSGCVSSPEPVEIALAAEATEKTIALRWDAVDGADRCRLFRKNIEGSDFKFVCDVTNGASYTDESVRQGEAYIYKLKVYDGATELAEGLCVPTALLASPEITMIRQLEGTNYEVEWEHSGKECIVYGQTPSGWRELGRSKDGVLRFENTENCTALAVASAGADAVRSDAVAFCGAGSILAATALDTRTNVIELAAPDGEWRYELARSDTKDGTYMTIGTAEGGVYYDRKDTESTTPYWYRFRCLGERSESAWSEPARLGTNARAVFYVPVMVYHEFFPAEEIDDEIDFKEDVITPEDFENDLIWLKNHGYTTITTAALAAYLEGGEALPKKPVILSIDDGKYSVYKWAWPLLKQYGMTGTLAVIGSMIDAATEAPQERANTKAPYCTWDEIGEMAASGAMEIISHTQNLHAFSHDGRQGANCAPDETAEAYLPLAKVDRNMIAGKIKQATGLTAYALAYPYSIRSETSDRAWLTAGYKLLLCGNNDEVHPSKWNPMIREAGLNGYSALLRRISRIEDTSIGTYLSRYENLLRRNG